MKTILASDLEDHLDVFRRLPSLSATIERSSELIARALAAGHKLLLCGNGGSAADSQHLAAEFTGRFVNDRRPLAALSLTTDTSALTCIANDYNFEVVFSRQVAALGRAGDCLIAISTSGNSANVVRAVETARSAGIHTIGLLGRDGGRLAKLCELAIVVSSASTARIQEAHIFIGHVLCAMVEESLQIGQPQKP